MLQDGEPFVFAEPTHFFFLGVSLMIKELTLKHGGMPIPQGALSSHANQTFRVLFEPPDYHHTC
jgi:hypothetical protein